MFSFIHFFSIRLPDPSSSDFSHADIPGLRDYTAGRKTSKVGAFSLFWKIPLLSTPVPPLLKSLKPDLHLSPHLLSPQKSLIRALQSSITPGFLWALQIFFSERRSSSSAYCLPFRSSFLPHLLSIYKSLILYSRTHPTAIPLDITKGYQRA